MWRSHKTATRRAGSSNGARRAWFGGCGGCAGAGRVILVESEGRWAV